MRSLLMAVCLLLCGNLTAQDFSIEDWIAQPIDNSVIHITIGEGPNEDINWREPAIIVFGYFDRLDGLKDSDFWRLQRHGRSHKADYLSNYYMDHITVNGRDYKSVEHYYQAVKFPIDSDVYNSIVRAKTANDARIIATNNAKLASLSHDDEMSNRMKYALWAKFVRWDGSPTDLGIKLLNTGNQPLIEGNNRSKNSDLRWGAEIDFSQMPQRATLKGKNLLGKLLMELREMLQERK